MNIHESGVIAAAVDELARRGHIWRGPDHFASELFEKFSGERPDHGGILDQEDAAANQIGGLGLFPKRLVSGRISRRHRGRNATLSLVLPSPAPGNIRHWCAASPGARGRG